MITTKKQSLIALTYFLIAAILGVVLGLFPISDIDANYRFRGQYLNSYLSIQ